MIEKLRESATAIQERIGDRKPAIAMVLGSGLGELGDELKDPIFIPYEEIPHYPVSTVAGHKGRLVCGELAGRQVLVAQGRQHFYEGYPMSDVIFPVRTMRVLGARTLVLTNAAGGINPSFGEGTLMLIEDHINLFGTNPLIGANVEELGPRFSDMTRCYSARLKELARQVAAQEGIDLAAGVYAGVTGPSYETPAEIRYLRTIGADAVGMSTVPEAIAARHGGMEIMGISCITNMAAGILDKELDHSEVMVTAERIKEDFKRLIRQIVGQMPGEQES